MERKLGYKNRHYTLEQQRNGLYRIQFDIYKILCYGLNKEYGELLTAYLNN